MKDALHEVATALEHATTEMASVRAELNKEKRARKIMSTIGVGLVALFILVSVFFYAGTKADCNRTNDARGNLRGAFTFLADTLVGENPPPDVQAERDEFVHGIEVRFPDIDC